MATITLGFANKINTSAQPGDTAYYVATNDIGGFKTSLNSGGTAENNIVKIGRIKSIASDRLSMVVNTTLTTNQHPAANTQFILFSKDNKVNMTSALGYYAEVKFSNNSTAEAELFSVGADIFESS
tara:strand:- start:396 stop:773 length:378 start_codon:yes stop_codon:yes gene_type:complete